MQLQTFYFSGVSLFHEENSSKIDTIQRGKSNDLIIPRTVLNNNRHFLHTTNILENSQLKSKASQLETNSIITNQQIT